VTNAQNSLASHNRRKERICTREDSSPHLLPHCRSAWPETVLGIPQILSALQQSRTRLRLTAGLACRSCGVILLESELELALSVRFLANLSGPLVGRSGGDFKCRRDRTEKTRRDREYSPDQRCLARRIGDRWQRNGSCGTTNSKAKGQG
jgi:hypothetical protein